MNIIYIVGPPITLTSKLSGVEVLKNTNGSLPQGPYIIKTPSLTVYNQRLWLIAVVQTDNKDGMKIEKFYNKKKYLCFYLDDDPKCGYFNR